MSAGAGADLAAEDTRAMAAAAAVVAEEVAVASRAAAAVVVEEVALAEEAAEGSRAAPKRRRRSFLSMGE